MKFWVILSWPEHPCITASSCAKTEIKKIFFTAVACIIVRGAALEGPSCDKTFVESCLFLFCFFSAEVTVPNKR